MSQSEPFKSRPHHSSATIPDLTDKIIRPNDWQYREAGGFGDVFQCRYMGDNGAHEVAVKAFRFSFSIDSSEDRRNEENLVRMIRRELGIWRRLSHPNIVPFLGITYGFGKQGSASLVSEWMPHGTLHTFLQTHDDRLTVAHRLKLLLDVANGLQYLHSFPMVHGDLTSNNVLLDHKFNARLTDFGCASLVGELPEGLTYLKTSTVRRGTLRWAAPESISLEEGETKQTIKSDIYSFGSITLLVLSGKYPWCEIRSDAAVVLQLSKGLKPGRPLERSIDDWHWTLIERCWSSIPERPPVEDLVSSLQQFLFAYPPPPPLPQLLEVPIPSSRAPNWSHDLGGDATPIDDQQIITYRYNGQLVYVPVAPNYIQALSHARAAFPELKHLHDASLSLTLAGAGKQKQFVGISAPAWPKLMTHMRRYQIIDVHVEKAHKRSDATPTHGITTAPAHEIVEETSATTLPRPKRSWFFQKLRGQ